MDKNNFRKIKQDRKTALFCRLDWALTPGPVILRVHFKVSYS